MHATIKDIARELGVSMATVSKALSDKPDISQEMKKKVREVASRLDYRRDYYAYSLVSGQASNLIGYIVPSVRDVFSPKITWAVEDGAFENDFNLLLGQSRDSFDRERRLIEDFLQKRVAGLIIIPAVFEGQVEGQIEYYQQIAKQIPLVFIDIHLGFPADYVLTNDEEAAYSATRHLTDLGHREIAVAGGKEGVYTTDKRIEGYRRALREAGIDPKPELEMFVGYETESALPALGHALEHSQGEYTALLCLSPDVFMTAQEFLTAKGLNIPEDVSAIAFSPPPGEGLLEGMSGHTMIEQPTSGYGAAAVELLMARIANRKRPYRKVVLPSTLRVGSSTTVLLT